jgi:hypothetical protein
VGRLNLKQAEANNETALFLIRKGIDMEELISKIHQNGIGNVNNLLSDNSLMIPRNEDWYIPDRQVDRYRIIELWDKLVARSTSSGKKGLRAFCMMDCFVENAFVEQVVDYEHTLPAKFDIPFVPICA